MPSKPIIVVLDDLKSRVKWLRKYFDSSTHIVWHQNVTDFISALNTHSGGVSLIILDHDLDMQSGSVGMSMGPDGLTGQDATDFIPKSFSSIPVLVWSRNGHGAEAMTKNLQKRGFKNVFTIMYGFDRVIWDLVKRVTGV